MVLHAENTVMVESLEDHIRMLKNEFIHPLDCLKLEILIYLILNLYSCTKKTTIFRKR